MLPGLKAHAERELNDSRVAGAADLAEGRAVRDARTGGVELRVVEEVEEIAAELRGEPVGDAEGLRQGPIQIESAGGAEHVARAASEGAGGGQRESRAVEPGTQVLGARRSEE